MIEATKNKKVVVCRGVPTPFGPTLSVSAYTRAHRSTRCVRLTSSSEPTWSAPCSMSSIGSRAHPRFTSSVRSPARAVSLAHYLRAYMEIPPLGSGSRSLEQGVRTPSYILHWSDEWGTMGSNTASSTSGTWRCGDGDPVNHRFSSFHLWRDVVSNSDNPCASALDASAGADGSAAAQAGSSSSTQHRENKKGKENVTPKPTSRPKSENSQPPSKTDEKKQTSASETKNPYESASAPASPAERPGGLQGQTGGTPGHIGWNPDLAPGGAHNKPNVGVPPSPMNAPAGMSHQGYNSAPSPGFAAPPATGYSGPPGGTYPGNAGMPAPSYGLGAQQPAMGMGGVSQPGMGMGGVPQHGMGMGGVPQHGMGMGGVPQHGMGMGGVPQHGMGMGGVPQHGMGMGGVPPPNMGGMPPNGMGGAAPHGMSAPYGNMGGTGYGGMGANPGMNPYGMGNMGSAGYPGGHHGGMGQSSMLGGLMNHGHGKPHSKSSGILPMLGAAGAGAVLGAGLGVGLGAGVGYQTHKMMHGMRSRLGDSDEDLIDSGAGEVTAEPETEDALTTVEPDILVDSSNITFSTTSSPLTSEAPAAEA